MRSGTSKADGRAIGLNGTVIPSEQNYSGAKNCPFALQLDGARNQASQLRRVIWRSCGIPQLLSFVRTAAAGWAVLLMQFAQHQVSYVCRRDSWVASQRHEHYSHKTSLAHVRKWAVDDDKGSVSLEFKTYRSEVIRYLTPERSTALSKTSCAFEAPLTICGLLKHIEERDGY